VRSSSAARTAHFCAISESTAASSGVAAAAANLAQRWALSRQSVELAGMIGLRCPKRGWRSYAKPLCDAGQTPRLAERRGFPLFYKPRAGGVVPKRVTRRMQPPSARSPRPCRSKEVLDATAFVQVVLHHLVLHFRCAQLRTAVSVVNIIGDADGLDHIGLIADIAAHHPLTFSGTLTRACRAGYEASSAIRCQAQVA
jgi:hypothetical protein